MSICKYQFGYENFKIIIIIIDSQIRSLHKFATRKKYICNRKFRCESHKWIQNLSNKVRRYWNNIRKF